MARTVLVVDDDETQCRATARLLRLVDVEAVVALSVDAAMAVLSEHPVDVVIADLHIGAELGSDLIARMAVQHPGLPTVLISGGDGSQLETTARACGATAFMTKPIDLDALIEVMNVATGGT